MKLRPLAENPGKRQLRDLERQEREEAPGNENTSQHGVARQAGEPGSRFQETP